MKTVDRELNGSARYQKRGGTKPRKRHYLSGDNRKQVDERRLKFVTAGVPQIEDSQRLDSDADPADVDEADKVIAAACEQFRLNHIPAPERVRVVEEVEDD